jgi:7-cyano-7-deazaguanine synthase
LNHVASMNRTHKVKIEAPFSLLSKYHEINICRELGKEELLKYTLTCYNPDSKGHSCGTCPSCAERIMNFAKAGMKDPIPYQTPVPWEQLIEKYKA